MPALSALVPELVKHEEIATAMALDRSVFHGSRLVGPSLAGLFVGWWGAASAFFCNAVSFLALIIAMISLPARTVGTAEEEEQRRSGFKEGFLYVRSDRTILSMIALIALTTIFVYPVVSVMLPLYVRNILHLGPDRLGFLMGTSAVGSLTGALGLLSVARNLRLKFMTGAVLLVAVALFFMSRSNSFFVTAASHGHARGWTLTQLRPRRNDRAGTRAGSFARTYLRNFRPQLFRSHADCGFDDAKRFRLDRNARRALSFRRICFGSGSVFVLTMCGRKICESPTNDGVRSPEPEVAPASVTSR